MAPHGAGALEGDYSDGVLDSWRAMSMPSNNSLEMVAPVDERIACEHAARCGGCPLIALTYGDQLIMKRGRVLRATTRYPSLELVHTEPVLPARPLVGYRTRAKLIVAPGGKLGIFAKGGAHLVIDVPQCRVLAPSLARIASLLRERVTAAESDGGVLAPFEASGRGFLRAIDLREVVSMSDLTRVLITLVVQRDREPSIEALGIAARDLMHASHEIVGVACNFHEGEAPQILGTQTVPLAGATSAPDRVGSSVHFATFGSFVQSHRGQAERVHAMLAEAFGLTGPDRNAKGKLRVLDLYGGSGAMALGLASAGADVRLIESFAPAVVQARAAAHAQALPLAVECADVTEALRALARSEERFDAVVVNPPRRGTTPSAREWLTRLDPIVIAYVSCNPETLARDLDHFARLGYATTFLRPLDMMPLTEEVETVALLRRTAIPMPRSMYADDEILVVEKGPHEPTTPQGEYRSSLLGRVRRVVGAENAVPVNRLDIGASGLVMFARSPTFVAKWERVLRSGSTRKIYVAAARGIMPSKGAVTRNLRDGETVTTARTRYRRLAVATGHSLLRVIPDHGRTDQIRRHFAAMGHPVIGDDRYGHAATNRFFEERNGLDRVFLHCVRLEFEHPDTRASHIVEAPLAGDLRAVLERMSNPGTLHFLDHKNALGANVSPSLPPGPAM